jgi:hypothetical protein
MIEPRSKLAAIRNGLSARLLSYTVSVSTTTMAEATSGQSRTYRSDEQCDQVSRIHRSAGEIELGLVGEHGFSLGP